MRKGMTLLLAIAICAALVFFGCVGSSPSKEETKESPSIGNGESEESLPVEDESDEHSTSESGTEDSASQGSGSTLPASVNVGDVITFGPYQWIVLAKSGNNAMLITKEAIACKPYNTSQTSVTWETCTLRSWLNSSFLGEFSAVDQAKIITTTVSNPNNPDRGTAGGNTTYDKVFLLSINEVRTYFGSDAARICYPNATAKSQGGYTDSDGACWWWLRSPGDFSDCPARVRDVGIVFTGGSAGYAVSGVRPALWVNLGS